jgi:hypothetical protein
VYTADQLGRTALRLHLGVEQVEGMGIVLSQTSRRPFMLGELERFSGRLEERLLFFARALLVFWHVASVVDAAAC